MLRSLLIPLIITVSFASYGQRDTAFFKSMHLPGVKIAYTGSLIYPGFSTGAEILLKTSVVTGTKNIPEKQSRTRNQLITLNINYYHHREFHDNLFLTAEWIYRKIRSGGFFSEYSAGAGFSRTFLNTTAYRVADDGTVSVLKHPGYNYALITAGGGIGFDFFPGKRVPLQAFTKMDIIGMYPYNNVIYLRPVLELGTRLSIGRYMEIRQREKNKNL